MEFRWGSEGRLVVLEVRVGWDGSVSGFDVASWRV
jgi:hypothetical protein